MPHEQNDDLSERSLAAYAELVKMIAGMIVHYKADDVDGISKDMRLDIASTTAATFYARGFICNIQHIHLGPSNKKIDPAIRLTYARKQQDYRAFLDRTTIYWAPWCKWLPDDQPRHWKNRIGLAAEIFGNAANPE